MVLGYATGYGVEHVEAFVRSLRSVYSGGAALFVHQDPALLAFLAAHDVEAVVVTPSDAWTPQPVVARFSAYERYIAARRDLRHVLMTDVRDVVFQGEPFAPAPTGLEVFVEYETGRMADHAFQIKHLRALAGEALAEQLEDRPCICAGTIVGPAEEAARLCRLILTLGAIPRSAVGGGFGVDQASLALAVGYGLIPAQVQDNYRRVATIGMASDGVGLKDGLIVNPGGGVSPVVHQYDRCPELVEAMRARWSQALPDRVAKGPGGWTRWRRKTAASVERRLPDIR
ncbi:hypothetical protein [Brevundimonas sp.]|uniref:hypothetical protein n=1 Tax=Brevundimonas sp. TaxID=1871086 RepID=UPI0028AB49F5|nr:hypothetical protein [Brevundimonas sp.]